MEYDLKYDYSEALKRQKHTQSDVNEIRRIISKIPHVPKTITDRKVKYNLKPCISQCSKSSREKYYQTKKFPAFAVPRRMRQY